MPSKDIKHAHPTLREKWPIIKRRYEERMPGYTLALSCTHRTPLEQKDLYEQGRSKPGPVVTQIDGVTKKGAHNYNPARAIAVMVMMGGKPSWSPSLYTPLGGICDDLGLEWGGHWKTFKDLPHIQLFNFRALK